MWVACTPWTVHNSKIMPHHYTKDLTFGKIVTVQEKCQSAMKVWVYGASAARLTEYSVLN